MLLTNDKQHLFGYFSHAGIKSSKENKLIFFFEKNKFQGKSFHSTNSNLYNKIKKDNHSKKKDFDIFTVEEPDKEKLEDIAQDIIKNNIKAKNSIDKKNNNLYEKKVNIKSKYYYHINHKKKAKKKVIVPSCTKYNPRYDAILKRTASTPLWKSTTGRKETKKDFYDFPFYINQELIQNNMAGKSFIDFSKQTDRKSFIENNNIHENNNNLNLKISRSFKNKSKILNKKKKNNINKDKNENKNDTDISNDSFEIFKYKYAKQLIKNKLENNKKKEKENRVVKKKIKSINFSQMLSRKSIEEIEDNKKEVVPFFLPNYKLIRERPVMMVIYDRKEHKIKKNRSEILLNVDNIMNYEKNPIHIQTPNFDSMISRPNDEKDPLPSYMRKIYDKNSCFKITGESLNINNYSNRGFSMNKSTFWPKTSFNKYMNLNFIKSKKNFYKALLFNNNKNQKGYKILEKSLNFYSKNYYDIIRSDNFYKYKRLLLKYENNNNKIPIKELIKKIQKEF